MKGKTSLKKDNRKVDKECKKLSKSASKHLKRFAYYRSYRYTLLSFAHLEILLNFSTLLYSRTAVIFVMCNQPVYL